MRDIGGKKESSLKGCMFDLLVTFVFLKLHDVAKTVGKFPQTFFGFLSW